MHNNFSNRTQVEEKSILTTAHLQLSVCLEHKNELLQSNAGNAVVLLLIFFKRVATAAQNQTFYGYCYEQGLQMTLSFVFSYFALT